MGGTVHVHCGECVCTCRWEGKRERERERGGGRESEATNLVFPLTRCAAEIIKFLEGSPLTDDQ